MSTLEGPRSFQAVLDDEARTLGLEIAAPATGEPATGAGFAPGADTDRSRIRVPGDVAGRTPAADGPTVPPRIGLALSGGGIRSATFSLGVLQALACAGKLSCIDYLSTVSGGGYIGSWLTAWIHRNAAKGGVDWVERQLEASVLHNRGTLLAGQAQKAADAKAAFAAPAKPHPSPPSPSSAAATADLVEPLEITWLRRYSNYLTPHVGALSLDSVTLVMTWLRNTTLNLILVLSAMAAVMWAAHLVTYVTPGQWQAARGALGWIALGIGLALMLFFAYNLANLHRRDPEPPSAIRQNSVRVVVSALGLGAMVAAGLWFFAGPVPVVASYLLVIGALAIVVTFWLYLVRGRDEAKLVGAYVWGGAAALAASFLVFWGARALDLVDGVPGAVTYGPALFLVAFGFCGSIYIGISGRAYEERAREWWSRMNAMLVYAGLAWLATFWVALYSRPTFDWAWSNAPGWTATFTTGWIASVIAILGGEVPKTVSTRTRVNVERVLSALTAVAAIGFVLAVALVTDAFFMHANPLPAVTLVADGSLADHLVLRDALYALLATPAGRLHLSATLLVLLAIVAVFALFAWRLDVNRFSLHNMYKNRLVRCYLGASAGPSRRPQPFIGFDEADDLALSVLSGSQRPLHLLNTTLNLSQGKNLAWQERKGASFVFSAQWCGYGLAATQGDTTYRQLDEALPPPPGYLPTSTYARRTGVTGDDAALTLGSAMATSGAAVSSGMGMHSSRLRAFLLTLFNARLGRWCPNPTRDPGLPLSPKLGLRWYLQELLGLTNEGSNYLHLSDGGHFENLGLYELVRRRCSVIVVVDGGADPARTFQDLGVAVRLCRVDFGYDIELEVDALRPNREGRARAGFAWGTVTYGPAERGVILYIKPTLTGSEPMDVAAYAARNASFPHQTTVDQFFDESQFEGYRRLGLHVGEAALASTEAGVIVRHAVGVAPGTAVITTISP